MTPLEAPTAAGAFLLDALLARRGVAHGFGLRTSPALPGCHRPRQVHGRSVAVLRETDPPALGEADAVVSGLPGRRVGVVTADCVPVLAAAADGRVVVAIHAGWRGVAAGVIAAGIGALRAEAERAGAAPDGLAAAVGPHVGACCYEVDEPVLAPLRRRFGALLDAALQPARPGHARLDLGVLVRAELGRAGLRPDAIGAAAARCTCCNGSLFHSFRRDGAAAGRLLHWIAACPTSGVDTRRAAP